MMGSDFPSRLGLGLRRESKSGDKHEVWPGKASKDTGTAETSETLWRWGHGEEQQQLQGGEIRTLRGVGAWSCHYNMWCCLSG